MAGTVGILKAVFQLDTKDAETSVGKLTELFDKKLSGAMHEMAEEAGALGEGLGALGPAGAGAAVAIGLVTVAAVGGFEAMVAMAERASKLTEELHVLELRTGLSGQALQQFGLLAKLVGSDVDVMGTMVAKMSVNLEKGSEMFGRLGLSIEDLKASGPEEAFRAIAEAITALESPIERNAAAIAIFGRGGAKELAFLAEVAHSAGDELERIGGAISDAAIAKGAAFHKETELLAAAWKNVGDQFAVTLTSSTGMKDFLTEMVRLVGALARVIKDHAADFESFFNMIGGIGVTVVSQLGNWFGNGLQLGAPGPNSTSVSRGALFGKAGGGGGGALGADPEVQKKLNAELDKTSKALTEMSHAAEQGEWKQFDNSMKDLDESAKELTAHAMELEKAEWTLNAALKQNNLEQEESNRLNLEAAGDLQAHDEKIRRIYQDIGQLGASVERLGQAIGSDLVEAIGAAAQAFSRMALAKTTMDKIGAAVDTVTGIYGSSTTSTGKSALKGAASGAAAGAALGPLGAVVGGIVGAVAGIFGSAAKQAEELKRKQAEAIRAFGDLYQQWVDAKNQLAETGLQGVAAIIDNGTTAQLANAGDYLAAAFEMLRKSGMSAADSLQKVMPLFQKLIAKGITPTGPLAELALTAAAHQAELDFIAGLGVTANALAGFGLLTQLLATKMSQDLGSAIDGMVGSGVSYQVALALNAQALYDLEQAALRSGVTLDDHTQKMIDDAKAAGLFKDLQDPMKMMVDAQYAMLAAFGELVTLLGGKVPEAVQKMIDEFNNAHVTVNVNVNPNTGTGTTGGGSDSSGDGDGEPHHARGTVTRGRQRAIIGEGGPEVVAPVAALFGRLANEIVGRMAAQAGDVHIYLDPTTGHARQLTTQEARRLQASLSAGQIKIPRSAVT